MEQVNFEKLVGQEVLIFSDALKGKSAPEKVTVRGVDAGGIWIECQSITDTMLKGIGKTMFEGTPLTYVPFWRISLAACGMDMPAISSESIQQ
jgi:hypothetical protein